MASSSSTPEVPTPADWNKQAGTYASNIPRFTSQHAFDLIAVLKKDIVQAKTILDIGCGTGSFGIAYLQHFPKGIPGQTLIMSDLSPGMLAKAETVLKELTADNFQTQLKFQVEDGATLDGIDDESIDVVVSIFGVFLIPDRAKALSSVRRILKPSSGVFGNAAWTSSTTNDSYLNDAHGFGVCLQDAYQCVKTEVACGSSETKMWWKDWEDPEAIKRMLLVDGDDAGFKTVDIHRVLHSVVWDFSDLWESVSVMKPILKMQEAGEVERVANVRMKLLNHVVKDGGDESSPVVLWTASNLSVARG